MAGGKFDIFIKDLFRENGKDVVAWLTGLTPIEVEPVSTELVVAEARLADQIFRVRLAGDPPEEIFLHVDVQTAGDSDMPRRMREYWTRAERTLIAEAKGVGKEQGKVHLSSFVVYLDRTRYRPDPGEASYRDALGTECHFRYRVIKIWEMDPRAVYRLSHPNLVPLAPLMRTADPVATMVESREIIRSWPPDLISEEKKTQLRLALAVYSGLVIEDLSMISELLQVDREWLERSVVVQDWLRQGREQGIAQGIAQGLILARRDDLLSVLRSRFGSIDPSMEVAILRMDDPQRLKDLHARALVAGSLEEFAGELAT